MAPPKFSVECGGGLRIHIVSYQRHVPQTLFLIVIACPHFTVYLQGTRPYLGEKRQQHITVVLEPAQVLPAPTSPLRSAWVKGVGLPSRSSGNQATWWEVSGS